MKLFNRYSCLLLTSISLFTTLSYANQNNELTIINHFGKPLQLKINVNHEVLPDFPVKFTLAVNSQINSKVVDIKKETYLVTEDGQGNSGFWGVDIENNKTHIHGYRSKGLAYSWKEQVIVFCTPEEYKKHKACLA
jgi:hypothetical protein